MGWIKELLGKDVRSMNSRAVVPMDGYGGDPYLAALTGQDEQTTQTKMAEYLATNTGVYVCSRYRSQLIASLPLKLYKSGGTKRTEVTAGPLRELLDRVNPFWTFGRLMEMTEYSMCVWGSNFWVLDRGERGGLPGEIWWVRADRMKVVPDTKGYISHYEYDSGTGQPIRFNRDEAVWLRYPNPLNELSGLSPLMSAKLTADMANAASLSNANIFRNGMQLSGIISPASSDTMWTETQVKDISEGLRNKLSGVKNAHRVGVIPREAKLQSISLSPKDAEFLGMMQWSFADLCRAYGIPEDLLGGQRTYQNYKEARLALWNDTLKIESTFIANELNEQLLPMFKGQADECAFDLSDVDVLQEAEDAKWDRWERQLDKGAATINDYLESVGKDPVPWGKVWWAPAAGGGVVPIKTDAPPVSPTQLLDKGGITVNEIRTSQGLPKTKWGDAWWAPPGLTPITSVDDFEPPAPPTISPADPKAIPAKTEDEPRSARSMRTAEYGSAEHERMWNRAIAQMEPWEVQFGNKVAELMRRQRQAVLARLRQDRSVRTIEQVADDPFDMPRWVKEFREQTRDLYAKVVKSAGEAAIEEINVAMTFDMDAGPVKRMIEKQAQRFAVQVNDTTWQQLKDTLTAGITDGDSLDLMAKRIEAIMGDRIKSSGEAIARTEVISSSNAARIEGWKQSGTVDKKEWVAALDERTRESHVTAHGQTVALDADFTVGGATGPGPGNMSSAGESVNCRCVVVPVIDVEV